MITKEAVLQKLKGVQDPELKINIVDLGLIYDLDVVGEDVFVLMTLTFPGCPLGGIIHKEVNQKLSELNGIGKIELNITFDPPWSLDKISQEGRAELGMM